MATLLVNTGRAVVTSRINGSGTTPSYVAWGTGAGTTSATAPALSDGFTTVAPWRYCRAVVTNITGTGATVQVLMGE